MFFYKDTHSLTHTEIDIIIGRLKAEWNQKKMDMYFTYLVSTYTPDKKSNDSSYVK